VSTSLASTGHQALAQAVSSAGEHVARPHSPVADAAGVAFSNGLNAALVTGCITVAVGAVGAIVLMRMRPAQAASAGEPAPEHA
jgi:hypothetical protein